MALTPEANIIKLPNISASLPQLKAAIRELQADGYEVRRVKQERNGYEIYAIARDGRRVEAHVNPVTGEYSRGAATRLLRRRARRTWSSCSSSWVSRAGSRICFVSKLRRNWPESGCQRDRPSQTTTRESPPTAASRTLASTGSGSAGRST